MQPERARLLVAGSLTVPLVKHLDILLQDQQPLEETMTLVEQCVQGEGLVQINVEIKVA